MGHQEAIATIGKIQNHLGISVTLRTATEYRERQPLA